MEAGEIAATFLCERGTTDCQHESRALLRKQLVFTVRRSPPCIGPIELLGLSVRFGNQILVVVLHISPMQSERRPARRVSDFELLELAAAARVVVRDIRVVERLRSAQAQDGIVLRWELVLFPDVDFRQYALGRAVSEFGL